MMFLGLAVTVFGALDFFSMRFADPFVLPKVVAMLAGVALMWASHARRGAAAVRPAAIDGPILLFALAMLATTAESRDPYLSLVGPHMGQFHSVLAFATCVAAYYAVRWARDTESLTSRVAIRWVVAAAAPMCAFGLMQAFGFDPLTSFPLPNGRIFSTQGGPVFLGAVLALLAPLALHLAASDGAGDRRLGWAVLPAIALCLVFTKTRGAIAAGFIGCAAYLVLSGRFARQAVIAIGGALGAVALAIIWTRASSLVSDLGRLDVWRAAVAVWRDAPMLGTGPDTFVLAFRAHIGPDFIAHMSSAAASQQSAHNDLLQVLSTMGLIGLAAYVVLLVGILAVVVGALRIPIYRESSAAVAAALLALFMVAKVNPVPLSATVIAAILLGSLPVHAEPEWRRRWIPSAAAALVSAAAIGMGWLLGAEWHQRKGFALAASGDPVRAAVEYNAAARVNRWETFYTQKQLEALTAMTPFAPPAARPAMAEMGVRIASRAAEMHPYDPDAQELLGRSLVVWSVVMGKNRLGEAMAAYERARSLAPTFPGILHAEYQIAAFTRDEATARDIGARIAAIHRQEVAGQ